MTQTFVIPDVHGSALILSKTLNLIPDSAKIVFLGAYIDRGVDNRGALSLVKDAVKNRGAIALCGNRPGWHSDGFMTDDINYVWSDANPTVFWVPDTPVELPQDHITSMDVMEDYAELDFEHHIRYPNCSILRLDESVIHKVDTDIDAGMRTFLKLSFSTEVYALKGNAINPDLKLDATYKDRTKHRNCPTGVHIEDTCDASS